MISYRYPYHNAVCDGCGHMLAAEKDDAAAETAMRADGWAKIEGKDLCRLCQMKLKETGRIPDKRFYKEERL